VLFYDADDGVMHLFHSQQGAGEGESEATVWYLNRTEDKPSGPGPYGWTNPVEIFSKEGSFPKNRLIETLGGDWLFPMYYTTESPNYSHIKTLAKGEDPTSAGVWGNIDFKETDNLVQPSVVRLASNEPDLAVFFRDRKKTSVYHATSPDDGQTWTSPKAIAGMANPNSGIEAFALASGRVALVSNPCTDCRDPLVLSLSDDGGETWPYTRVLEMEDGEQEFSYPTLREDKGSIHVSYTYKRDAIKHSIVSEDWVMDPNNQYNATATAL
jgi:predicted neuraminidase